MFKYPKKKFRQWFVYLSISLFVLTLNACAGIYQSGFVSVPHQPISSAVTIGSEWVEIVPPTPLKPFGSEQWVNLGYTEYSKSGYSDGVEGTTLNLADGRKTRIEAFLYDDKGENYELQIGGVGGGVVLSRKMLVINTNGKPDYKALDFPTDRTYTKLRIRSEIPLKVNQIEWVGHNPK